MSRLEAKKTDPSSEKRLAKLRADYQRLKEQIQSLSHVVPGSVQKRLYSCGKPNCRCVTEGRLHGPYYQWTRKIKGKTVNINLDQETAVIVREWIRNDRQLRKLCSRLEKTSLAVLKIVANLKKIE